MLEFPLLGINKDKGTLSYLKYQGYTFNYSISIGLFKKTRGYRNHHLKESYTVPFGSFTVFFFFLKHECTNECNCYDPSSKLAKQDKLVYSLIAL